MLSWQVQHLTVLQRTADGHKDGAINGLQKTSAAASNTASVRVGGIKEAQGNPRRNSRSLGLLKRIPVSVPPNLCNTAAPWLAMRGTKRGSMKGYPNDNPKAAIGALKVPLHLVPPSAKHFLALALEDGAKKYGPYNWRQSKVSFSTYYGAAQRHSDACWDGEDVARDSLVHHLSHAMACYAIVLDALHCGMLIDDRPPRGGTPKLQDDYLARSGHIEPGSVDAEIAETLLASGATPAQAEAVD